MGMGNIVEAIFVNDILQEMFIAATFLLGHHPSSKPLWGQICFEIKKKNLRILKGNMVHTLNIYITPLERNGSPCK